MQNNPIYGITS
jgi:hypothetical protein